MSRSSAGQLPPRAPAPFNNSLPESFELTEMASRLIKLASQKPKYSEKAMLASKALDDLGCQITIDEVDQVMDGLKDAGFL